MTEALKMARKAFDGDEVPVGAVIIHKNQMIAKAHNQIEMLKDPTAHAEMIAITQAAHALSQKWLLECTMYVTVEPCSMCAGALVLARIKKLFFAAPDPKAGACVSVVNIVNNPALNHRIEVAQGLLGEECAALMREFFERKREAKKLSEMVR
jgi:tRNA(adenine34) deaminase